MSIYSRLIIFAFLLLTAGPLLSQVKVEVTDGTISEYNLAVSPVHTSEKELNELSSNITKAMEMAFNLTGFFNVLDSRSFLEKPQTKVNEIDFKTWMNVSAKGLIKGYLKGGAKPELELYFFDVAEGKKILQKTYKASPKMLKKAAYRFVNELVYLLTGEEMTFMFSRIAFVEKKKGMYSIITMDFDGSNKKIVHSSKKILLLPEWSADGKKIFFTSYEKNNPNLYSIDVRSKRIRLVSSYEGLNTSATAHPDGKNIALRLSKDGNAELYMLDTVSGKLKRLTRNMAIDTAPSFSPDGKEIAFVSNRSGNPHIYRVWTNNTSRVERLTVQGKYNQDPDYSPDGKYIAFTGRDEFYNFDIFIFNISTRVISRVTQKQSKNETPSFSPDSKLLVFSSNRKGHNAIYLSNVKGDKQVMVYYGNGEAITPAWSPQVIK